MAFGRSVLVTGANRGLGLELIKQLLAARPTPEFVFATHRSPAGTDSTTELESLQKENNNLHLLQLDVTDEAGIQRAVDAVQKATGEIGLNLLINNSGMNRKNDGCCELSKLAKSDLMAHLEVNSVAPVMLCQAFLPVLQRAAEHNSSQALGCRRAAAVHITSQLGSLQMSGEGRFSGRENGARRSYAYRASKSALNMFARVMSYELLPLGVLTMMVHPGWVKTDMGSQRADLEVADSVSAILENVSKLDESGNGSFVNYTGEPIPW